MVFELDPTAEFASLLPAYSLGMRAEMTYPIVSVDEAVVGATTMRQLTLDRQNASSVMVVPSCSGSTYREGIND